MSKKHEQEDPLVEMGYETRDVSVKPLAMAMLAFLTFVTLTYIVTIPIFRGMSRETQPSAPFSNKIPPPPNPLLQTNITAKTDIMDLRRAETEELTTSGIVDANKGVYRIPIDRAIDLIAQRGLPEKPDAQVVSGPK